MMQIRNLAKEVDNCDSEHWLSRGMSSKWYRNTQKWSIFGGNN